MPSFHRTLERLSIHATDELKRMVQRLGGAYALDHFEVTVDQVHSGGQYVLLRIWFMHRPIWEQRLHVPGLNAGYVTTQDQTLANIVTHVMKEHLDLVAQMHHAWLDRQFPNSIKEVRMERNLETDTKMICVIFKNGHKAIGPESDVKKDIFLARCAMIYDLPPI